MFAARAQRRRSQQFVDFKSDAATNHSAKRRRWREVAGWQKRQTKT